MLVPCRSPVAAQLRRLINGKGLSAAATELASGARSYANATLDAADRKTDGHAPGTEAAKSAGETVVQGVSALFNKAQAAVSGGAGTTDGDHAGAAGHMQQRRDAHTEDQDPSERYSNAKDKTNGHRPINEVYPDMGKAAEKQHKTGDGKGGSPQAGSAVASDP